MIAVVHRSMQQVWHAFISTIARLRSGSSWARTWLVPKSTDENLGYGRYRSRRVATPWRWVPAKVMPAARKVVRRSFIVMRQPKRPGIRSDRCLPVKRPEDRAGSAIALSGDGMRLAVGAKDNDAGGNQSGSVRVYALGQFGIAENASTQTIPLSGITAGFNESQVLQVTATSDNVGLIPDPAVDYTSPSATGSLLLTPVAGQYGSATITVTITDGGADDDLATSDDNSTTTRTFDVVVLAAENAAPTGVALANTVMSLRRRCRHLITREGQPTL